MLGGKLGVLHHSVYPCCLSLVLKGEAHTMPVAQAQRLLSQQQGCE